MKLLLKFPIPPTLNAQIRHNRGNKYRAAQVKKEWDAFVKNKCAKLLEEPFQKAWIACCWQTPTQKNDPDNLAAALKYIFDGLVLGGVLQNDNLTVIQSPITHFYVRGENTVQILISDAPLFSYAPLQNLHEFAVDLTHKI